MPEKSETGSNSEKNFEIKSARLSENKQLKSLNRY